MDLKTFDLLLGRLQHDFPEIDLYALLQTVASTDTSVHAPSDYEQERRVEELCRAALRLQRVGPNHQAPTTLKRWHAKS